MIEVIERLIFGLIITVNLFKKFKETSKGYKYFPLEKKIIYISGVYVYLCLVPGVIITGTLVQPLYYFRYFLVIAFLVTTVAIISILNKR